MKRTPISDCMKMYLIYSDVFKNKFSENNCFLSLHFIVQRPQSHHLFLLCKVRPTVVFVFHNKCVLLTILVHRFVCASLCGFSEFTSKFLHFVLRGI
jgi:hypothetical protein